MSDLKFRLDGTLFLLPATKKLAGQSVNNGIYSTPMFLVATYAPLMYDTCGIRVLRGMRQASAGDIHDSGGISTMPAPPACGHGC